MTDPKMVQLLKLLANELGVKTAAPPDDPTVLSLSNYFTLLGLAEGTPEADTPQLAEKNYKRAKGVIESAQNSADELIVAVSRLRPVLEEAYKALSNSDGVEAHRRTLYLMRRNSLADALAFLRSGDAAAPQIALRKRARDLGLAPEDIDRAIMDVMAANPAPQEPPSPPDPLPPAPPPPPPVPPPPDPLPPAPPPPVPVPRDRRSVRLRWRYALAALLTMLVAGVAIWRLLAPPIARPPEQMRPDPFGPLPTPWPVALASYSRDGSKLLIVSSSSEYRLIDARTRDELSGGLLGLSGKPMFACPVLNGEAAFAVGTREQRVLVYLTPGDVCQVSAPSPYARPGDMARPLVWEELAPEAAKAQGTAGRLRGSSLDWPPMSLNRKTFSGHAEIRSRGEGGERAVHLDAYPHPLTGAFDPRGTGVAVGYQNGCVGVYQLTVSESGVVEAISPQKYLPAAGGPIATVQYSADGSLLLTVVIADDKCRVQLWRVDRWVRAAERKSIAGAHGPVECLGPDGSTLLTRDDKGGLTIMRIFDAFSE